MPEQLWPAGCPKNSSCARNGGCMYGCEAHRDRPRADLRAEIAADMYRRIADADVGQITDDDGRGVAREYDVLATVTPEPAEELKRPLLPLEGPVERRVLGNIMRQAGFTEEQIYARLRPLTLP